MKTKIIIFIELRKACVYAHKIYELGPDFLIRNTSKKMKKRK